MQRMLEAVKKHQEVLFKVLPLIAFTLPLLFLYMVNPSDPYLQLSGQDSFNLMWKGRTFQLFFIWLIGLELVLAWESVPERRIKKLASPRTALFVATLALPTLYLLACYYGGLNGAIASWMTQANVPFANSMPLSVEYLVFTVLFILSAFSLWGFKGLKTFSVPALFLALVGLLYVVDNVFPYGEFTPFQIFVPTTTALAAAFMNLMGYTTNITYGQNGSEGNMPFLTMTDSVNPTQSARFAIAWPCAGIESFLIFTVVILLFLKRMPMSWKAKIGYFALGAAVTYVINAFRIVSIFQLGMAYGETSNEVQMFHFYYGPLYAVAWIVLYPLIIFGSQMLWRRYKTKREPVTLKRLPTLPPNAA
jgi:thaumarchaeosortase